MDIINGIDVTEGYSPCYYELFYDRVQGSCAVKFSGKQIKVSHNHVK